MKKSNKFSPEVRERAVRMVQERRGEYLSLWAAIEFIAPQIGRCRRSSMKGSRVEVDTGVRDDVTSAEAQRVMALCTPSVDGEEPLQRMAEAIKRGGHSANIPFDLQGQSVQMG